jgi:AcrR family transcriptional regulator
MTYPSPRTLTWPPRPPGSLPPVAAGAETELEKLRRTHGESKDPRVSRTRAAVFAAVEELVSRGAAITVADIVRTADVSRTSFYAHFAGFDELALQVFQRSHAEVAVYEADLQTSNTMTRRDAITATYQRLVEHYVRHRPLYEAVLAQPLSRTVHTRAVRSMVADLEPLLDGNPDRPQHLRPHLAASFIASAVVGFLDEWLEHEVDAPPDVLLDHLLALLPQWYTGMPPS